MMMSKYPRPDRSHQLYLPPPPTSVRENVIPFQTPLVPSDFAENNNLFDQLKKFIAEQLALIEGRLLQESKASSYSCVNKRVREVENQGYTVTPTNIGATGIGLQEHPFMPTNIEATEVRDKEYNFDGVLNVEDGFDMMNDADGPEQYYLTPSPPIVDEDNLVLEIGNAVEEVTSKIDDHPFRKKKRSLFLQTPYMVPKKRIKYRHNSGLHYDPLREVPESKKASFHDFMSKPYSGVPIKCGVISHDQQFFKEIIDKGNWLRNVHIEEALSGLRKRQNKYNDIFNQDIAVLDETFTQLLIIALRERGQNVNYRCDSSLQAYWNGCSLIMGKPWKNMKALYTVLHVNEQHWVAIKVDIQKCELIVFDCNLATTEEGTILPYMEPLCTMIPILLQ